MTEKKKFYIAVKALFVKDSKALLMRNVRGKWQGKVHWDFPGGRIHEDEPIDKALRREVREETGIQEFTIGKIVATHLLGTDLEPRIGMLLLIFRCTTESAKITLTPEEHDMYGWFSKDEIEKLGKFEGDEDMYRQVAITILEDGQKS